MQFSRISHFITTRMHASAFAIVLSSVALAAAPAAAQYSLPSDSVVRATIRERVSGKRSSGIAVGLIDANGKRRFIADGAGDNGAPLDEHSVFEIGSVTKTFTASLLADMVARGEVRLDQPVAELLGAGAVIPERNGRKITLVDLATQSSGLPRMPSNFAPADRTNPYADYDGPKLLTFLAGHQLTRDVGEKYEYSNLGMGLLGFALARKANVSYERLVTERVLRPLEMRESAITLSPAMAARLAPGHDESLMPTRTWDLDALGGAEAIRSTVSDMVRYLAAHMDSTSKPLGKTFAMTHGRRFGTAQPNLSLGLAWHRLNNMSGDTLVWHNGQTGGYHSWVGYSPALHVGIVILSNSATSIDDIALHFMDGRIPLTKPPVVRTEVAVAPDVLETYLGVYQLAPTFAITVTREGAQLFIQATGQPRFPAFAEAEGRFFLRVVDAQIEFTKDGSGTVDALILVQNGARQRASKGK